MRDVLLLAGLGALGTAAEAQISPGPLSRAHAGLEGNSGCLACHDREQGVAASKCLACHTVLGARVKGRQGLHARADHADCKTCHVEHQGKDFELVYWGKAGRAAFDHARAGWALEGKHAGLACEGCHQAKFRRLDESQAAGQLGSRSFLGLPTACGGCHADPHTGTKLAGRECTACHAPSSWRPAARFDHAATGFPLTGRHAAAACDGCHRGAAPEPALPRRVLPAVKGRECASCHEDTHAGRLGTACAPCHTTASWRAEAGKPAGGVRLDHERTRYPLRGRHASVACAGCHRPGQPLKVRHERCTDCHADRHHGQFERRADQGRCESCHDVFGFAPARYALADHQKTGYRLEGAHLAVPCDACHRRVTPQALRGGVLLAKVAPTGTAGTPVFRFAATRCASCHADPHRGEVDKHLQKGGCEACHSVEAWKPASFDHATTRFPLRGGHARPCAACHKVADAGTPRQRVVFTGLSLACADCHRDPHAGQFAVAAGGVACDRCHTTTDLRATRFEHNRDAAYALDGAHARVPCASCHPTETRGGRAVVRYKPLGQACKDCHAAAEGPRP